MNTKLFRAFTLFMIFALLASPMGTKSVAGAEDAPADPITITGDDTVSLTSVVEDKGATGPALYIVQLEDDSLASYGGGIIGLDPTSPTITGKAKLDTTNEASRDYLNYLDIQQTNFLTDARETLQRVPEVAYRYTTVLNGLAIELTPEEAAAVSALPGVRKLFREKIEYPTTDAGPKWIGADKIWNGDITGLQTKGEGVIVGILDTGINPASPSFADTGSDSYSHENPNGAGKYVGVCDSSNEAYDSTFPCNDKLIGAWSFVNDEVNDPDSPKDSDSHGSHTASTTAGNVLNQTINGVTVSLSGVAPHANIIAYDVCVDGCSSTSSVAAIDQAITDGVDVINYSISGGTDPYNDAVELAFLDAVKAGVVVATSAGNDGPAERTVNHLSPWTITVGSSTHNRVYKNSLTNMTGGENPPAEMVGRSFTNSLASTKIVYAGAYNNALCQPFSAGTDLSNTIVVCDRGTNGRVEKSINAKNAGAAGFVLVNASASEGLVGDQYAIPGVHLTYDQGVTLKAWLATTGDHYASIGGSVKDESASNGDILADTSSRGPNVTLDVLKPDLVAPGVDILAAVNTGSNFDFMSGTSMASPHTAGAAALLKALHPTWTPAQIKSALMTTGVTSVRSEDGVTPANPHQMGAGRIDLAAAAQAGLLMDETYTNYNAAVNGSVNTRNLNVPSLYNSMCLHACSWTRTVTSSVAGTWSAVDLPSNITVSPASFSLAAGGSQTITITVDVTGLSTSEWVFGTIKLTENSSAAPAFHMPMAVLPSTGILPEQVTIETARDTGSKLAEDLQAIAITDLTVTSAGLFKSTPYTQDVEEFEASSSDPVYNHLDLMMIKTVTVPAGASRLVTEITASTSLDADLYLGLDANGDGIPQKAEGVCTSATGAVLEYCDLNNPSAGTYWVLVNNWAASAQSDEITLNVGIVGAGDQGNLTATAPKDSFNELEPFDLRIRFDEPDLTAGDYWYGVLFLGSDATHPGNIGAININLVRKPDQVTQTVSPQTARVGDTVTYTIQINPNESGESETLNLEETLPDGLELVPGSITGGGKDSGNTITWSNLVPEMEYYYQYTTSETDSDCVNPLDNTATYVNLADYGITPQSSLSGDKVVAYWSIAPGTTPYNFYGTDYSQLSLTDDGIVLFGFNEALYNAGTPGTPQHIPSTDYPNNLLAFLWQDMNIVYDATKNQGISLATIRDAAKQPIYGLIEYDDIHVKDDASKTYDVEIFARRGASDIRGDFEFIVAYDNLNGPLTNVTIGAENATGTDASALVNQGDATGVVENGLLVCYNSATRPLPIELSYQAKVTSAPSETIVNTVYSTVVSDPGSKPEGASVELILEFIKMFLPVIAK